MTTFDTSRFYPGNSDIHARKAQGRRQRTAVSFAEKLDALDDLRERVEPIVRAREARRSLRAAAKATSSSFGLS